MGVLDYIVLYIIGLIVCGISVGTLTQAGFGWITIGGGLILIGVCGLFFNYLRPTESETEGPQDPTQL